MSTTLPREVESKYVVLEKMGEGGMGAVYKVRHRFFDEIQVLKFMQAQFQENEELKSRFLQEARTAKKVRHRNIAEVIDYSVTADGTAYIVMEFVDGVNLREILKRTGGPLDYALVIEIGFQTLAALGELHKHGFVHRDISPDNLILSRDPAGQPLIKVIDLGIAKSVEHQTQDLTKTGRFMGKMQYASPEQFGGIDGEARVDQRSDLYSFGAVLYELLTGSRLVASSDYRAIIAAALYRPPRPFEETDPHGRVPQPLREVVLRALAKDANDRYQNADEFSAALRRVSGQSSTAPPVHELSVTHTEETAWRAAEAKPSVAAWERYLEAFPDSPRASDARHRLEEIEHAEEADWEKASAADNLEGWNAFLSRHSDSPRASRARRRMERLTEDVEKSDWDLLAQRPSIEAYERYLSTHPKSKRASQVRSELNRMREEVTEEQDWSSAASVESTGAWRDFLRKHPRSSRLDTARSKLDLAQKRDAEETDWKRAMDAQTSAAWKEFLQVHPQSTRAAEARKHLNAAQQQELDTADYESSKRVDTSESWQTYLDRHPKSKRVASAKKLLAEAHEREEKSLQEVGARHEREVEDRAWKEATDADTPEGYEQFLSERPNSKYAVEARKRYDDALADGINEWKRTIDIDTADAYESFARTYAQSRHASEAQARSAKMRERAGTEREQRDWDAAQTRGTVDAWRDYLQAHPESNRSTEARRNVEAAAERVREEADFSLAISRDDAASLRRFLDEHPKSERTEDVRKRISVMDERKRSSTIPTLEVPLAEALAKAEKEKEKDPDLPETFVVAPGEGLRPPRPRSGTPAKGQAQPAKGQAQPAKGPAQPSTTTQPVVPVPQMPPAKRAKPAAVLPANPQKIIIGAAAAIAVIVGFFIVKSFMGPDKVADTKPADTTSGETAAGPTGQLVINALPWGEVKSVTDANGKDYLTTKPVYTPLTLSLPPGNYTVELVNPNSRKKASQAAVVAAGKTAHTEAELDAINADDYFNQITKKK